MKKPEYKDCASLSPCVEEPLNSKVIKSFVPEQRSRKCFSCFEIPKFYLYGHSIYVSHIAISWLGYMCKLEKRQQRIYDLLKTETKSKRISEIIGVSLWLPSSRHHNPLNYAIWGVLEKKQKKQMQLSI